LEVGSRPIEKGEIIAEFLIGIGRKGGADFGIVDAADLFGSAVGSTWDFFEEVYLFFLAVVDPTEFGTTA
jgi:hypothetical protein